MNRCAGKQDADFNRPDKAVSNTLCARRRWSWPAARSYNKGVETEQAFLQGDQGAMPSKLRPSNLKELRDSGWVSKTVKQEIRDNFLRMLREGDELFPGIIGYENTVIPEINLALIAGHDLLFLGEKGQAKSRLMRSLVRFLDEEIPYLAEPTAPVHEDPYQPITNICKRLVGELPEV